MKRQSVNRSRAVWKFHRVLSYLFGLVCLLAATAAPTQVQSSTVDFETEALDLETGQVELAHPLADSNAAEELPPTSLGHEAWGAIIRSIERDVYGARPAVEGAPDHHVLEAANPAQAYSTRFTPQGILVRPRDANFEVGFSLTAWGYGGALNSAPPAPPRAEGERVTYVRGPLEEWYVNRASGLEQGFTLTAPPQGAPSAAPLRLELVLSGPLVAETSDGGILLRDGEGGIRLRYTGLEAWDATGRILPARMTVAETTLGLEIDATGAVYPLTIDPLLLNEDATLLAGDAALRDYFGFSVAVSGDIVVVGAIGTDAAYLFEKPAGGWDGDLYHTAKLLPDVPTRHFGASVAVSGDTVVVGAPLDHEGGWDSGSAFVFERPTGGWVGAETLGPTAKLLADGGGAKSQFGWSVAVSGDTVVVGAVSDDDSGARSGSAYVFEKPAGGWAGATPTTTVTRLVQTARLRACDGAAGDELGFSVAISGGTVAVGAVNDDDRGFPSGSAYIFERPTGGWPEVLSQTAKLLASDPTGPDQFGISVAVSGDTVVVGARRPTSSGSAYIFERPGSGWTGTVSEAAKLLAADGAAGDYFGTSVSISGNTVVVGAVGKGGRTGSAYIFERPGSGWTGDVFDTYRLLASDGVAGDSFGNSVSISGDTAVVGAWMDHTSVEDSGSAYVFWLADADGDGVPDGSDNCPIDFNPAPQPDSDGDELGDACDPCPLDPDNDIDGDGVCGDVDSCPLDPDNDIDGDGVCGDVDNCPTKPNPAPQPDSDGDGLGDACDTVVQVSVGSDHTCVRRVSGHIYCWGGNFRGQLGNGTTSDSSTPVLVQALTNTTWLSAGGSYTCAVQGTTVYCWGHNYAGQLGDGTTTTRTAPVRVLRVGDGAARVAAGLGGHTCAVSEVGEVYCWGANSEGQLGDGWTNSSTTPVRVHGYGRLEIDARGGADQVSVGEVHSCAIRDDAVECWGSNGSGQIRPGSPDEGVFLTPVAVHEGRQVSAGIEDTCAVGSGGVVCWGALFSFQTAQDGFEPIAGVDAGISAIGDGFNCGIVSGDQVACWDDSLTATPVPGLSGVTEVSAGPGHACALRNDGEVFCWGGNAKGQLGDGTTNSSGVPVQVVGLYN